MSRSRAVRSGFATILRNPAIFIAELAWRWSFGAAAILISGYGVLLFFRSLPVSDRDMLGLSGAIPGGLISALKHVLAGSGPKLLMEAAAVFGGTSFLWLIASSWGRGIVLREIIAGKTLHITSKILKINLLRIVILTIFLVSIAACTYLWFRQSALEAELPVVQNQNLISLVLFPLLLLIGWLWSSLNWYLSLAVISRSVDDSGLLYSIASAVSLSGRRFGQFFWVGLVFGVGRIILLGTAVTTAFGAIRIFAQFSTTLTICLLTIIALIYCALAVFFATARLASYIRIMEWDSMEPLPQSSLGLHQTAQLNAVPARS